VSPTNTAPNTTANAAAKIADAVAKQENFDLLITKESLAKDIASWLSQHAKLPTELRNIAVQGLVDRVIMRTGFHIFAAKQGSFKSIMALFLALSLVTGQPYLGRDTQTQFDEDSRPLCIYYIDRENPESYARACCLRITLGDCDTENGNVFKVLGQWQDEEQPIVAFDDPRILEAAKRERAFFIFDSLSQFIGTASENDNSEMTMELNKAKALARICEGVLVLHHDDKGQSGWRGCTAIVAVPDMVFNLSRDEGTNRVTFGEIRFRPTGPYSITAQVSFDAESADFNRQYTYAVVESSLDPRSREAKKTVRLNSDAALIEAAGLEIEKNTKEGKKPLSQRSLARLVGIASSSVRDRVLCQNTPTNPRPWKMVPGKVSLEFHPVETEPLPQSEQTSLINEDAAI
jgi:hypothetical protein